MIAVIQSLISSEVAIPYDSAMILSVCKGHPAVFFDLNDSWPDDLKNIDLIYLSGYTVQPFSIERDLPLVRASVKGLKERGARNIVVGLLYGDEKEGKEILKAGANQVLIGDTASLFEEVLSGNENSLLVRRDHLSLLRGIIPDYDLIPLGRYRRSIFSAGRVSLPAVFSRGKSSFQKMPDEELKTYIKTYLSRYHVNHLMIEDDLFNHTREDFQHFCRLMKENFPDVTWECLNGLHPAFFTKEEVDLASEAGCRHIALGFESFHKGMEEVVKHAHEKGLVVSGYFVWELAFNEIKSLRESAIPLIHFSSLKSLDPYQKILKALALLYIYLTPERITLLLKMNVFSRKNILRIVEKLRG